MIFVIEFNIKNRPNRKLELKDYDMTIRKVGERRKNETNKEK